MNSLYLTYHETSTGGEVCAGDEDSDWPNYETTYVDWYLKDCYKNNPCKKHYCYTEEVKVEFPIIVGSTISVVYVRYSTGNTFGRTCGTWCIVGVYQTLEEANKIKTSIDNKTYDGYEPWVGYFEEFERCEVEEFIIEN